MMPVACMSPNVAAAAAAYPVGFDKTYTATDTPLNLPAGTYSIYAVADGGTGGDSTGATDGSGGGGGGEYVQCTVVLAAPTTVGCGFSSGVAFSAPNGVGTIAAISPIAGGPGASPGKGPGAGGAGGTGGTFTGSGLTVVANFAGGNGGAGGPGLGGTGGSPGSASGAGANGTDGGGTNPPTSPTTPNGLGGDGGVGTSISAGLPGGTGCGGYIRIKRTA